MNFFFAKIKLYALFISTDTDFILSLRKISFHTCRTTVMNELLNLSARIWHAGPDEITGKGRAQYICCARYTFVILALVGGFTRKAISEFTGWNVKMVDYYAGKAITDEVTLPTLQGRGLISIAV